MMHDMATRTISLSIRLHMTEANTPGILNIFSQLRSYVLYKMSDTQGDVMRAVLIVNHDTAVHILIVNHDTAAHKLIVNHDTAVHKLIVNHDTAVHILDTSIVSCVIFTNAITEHHN